jgi:uncharacterized protein (TIGR02145 family)
MKHIIMYCVLMLALLLIMGCNEKSTEPKGTSTTVTDVDGNVYTTVKIGEQWWMAENLRVTHYRNGEAIVNLTDNDTLEGTSTGALCAYDNDTNNVYIYGYLYNGFAIENNRNIAPTGWHVPTDEEWKELEMNLGMSRSEADESDYRGTDEGGKLKETGTSYWNSPNAGATNESRFSALPGGYRYNNEGVFGGLNLNTGFWSSTESEDSTYLAYRYLAYDHSDIYRSFRYKTFWFSVRLTKD